jgi:hypothetical protein
MNFTRGIYVGQGFYWLGDPASNFLTVILVPAHSRNGGGFWEKSHKLPLVYFRTGEAVAEEAARDG